VYPETIATISPEELDFAEEFISSDLFKEKFNHIC
jgi:hypothetical protein